MLDFLIPIFTILRVISKAILELAANKTQDAQPFILVNILGRFHNSNSNILGAMRDGITDVWNNRRKLWHKKSSILLTEVYSFRI